MASISRELDARRRLGTELRSLRTQALRTGQDVAAALGWSQAKISRTEQARTLPPIQDLRALITELRPPAPIRKQLFRLAEEATRVRPNRRTSSGAGPTRHQHDLLALERECSAIRHYQPMRIPEYMQTPEYARSVIDMAGGGEQGGELQAARQRTMTDPGAPLYSVLLTEATLLWRPGPPSMMAQQLEHVAVLAELPNVDLRVLRLEGPHATYLHSPCVIFDFGDSDWREALLETAIEHIRVTDQAGLEQLHQRFEWLFAAALAPRESMSLIRATAKSYVDNADPMRGAHPSQYI